MKRIAVLFLAVIGVAACGVKGASSEDEAENPGQSKVAAPPERAEPRRAQIPDTEVPLFVGVEPTGNEADADRYPAGAVPCRVSLSWGDGQNASDGVPWTGSLPVGESTEVTFHLVLPVTRVNFEYVVARVSPRSTAEGGIRFDIETTCYACIR